MKIEVIEKKINFKVMNKKYNFNCIPSESFSLIKNYFFLNKRQYKVIEIIQVIINNEIALSCLYSINKNIINIENFYIESLYKNKGFEQLLKLKFESKNKKILNINKYF
jgi:hypothetical protein